MKRRSEAAPAQQTARAIICFDPSGKLWNRLKPQLEGRGSGSPGDFILARATEAATDLVALCGRLIPALLVIEDTGIEAVRMEQLREMISRCDLHVLAISDRTDDSSFEHFFELGCAGVLSTSVKGPTLRRAIESVFAGELWMPRRVLSRLARRNLIREPDRGLTRRESEILKLIRSGLTNQAIADSLFISRETVRWHVRGLYAKIGVHNRLSAIQLSGRSKD